MPNPIRPSGRPRSFSTDDPDNPINEAIKQDRERRLRDDELYYQQTGIRRPPLVEHSVLIPEDSRIPDIANDGDSYIENAPSEIIDPIGNVVNTRNNIVRERNNVTKKEKQSKDLEFQQAIEKSREQIGNSIEGLDL